MNTYISRAALALKNPILAATIAGLGLFPLQGNAKDSPLATYRCVVSGQADQCHPSESTSDVRIEKQLVLGPYARYLVYRGESARAAAARAQALGEQTVERTVRITKRELDAFRRYQRAVGGLAESDYIYETVSEVAVDASAVQSD
ncbi:hypothetical protein [Methylibium sp. T29]|uniref:hypothetical protein n=1 Tax=Methylibium sp. T29 TaxID=1430884 RepID=UPI0003F46B31|nr:hypothetical protein [Methylibium sp. T29]EWS57030.1 hypothetical protein X551_00164 [Methylibium sp. T29]